MKSDYQKKSPLSEEGKVKQAEQDRVFRKLTLQAHKLELLLIRLTLDVSNLEERSEAETLIRHSLDYVKKATRLLAKGR